MGSDSPEWVIVQEVQDFTHVGEEWVGKGS